MPLDRPWSKGKGNLHILHKFGYSRNFMRLVVTSYDSLSVSKFVVLDVESHFFALRREISVQGRYSFFPYCLNLMVANLIGDSLLT